MIKKYRTKVLELTQYILEQYWQSNQEPLVSHLDKNILWIGSMDEEYVHGASDMIKRLQENKSEMPPVFLDEEEYGIVQNEGNTCVVAGRYRAFTKPESGVLISEKQRVTFVWEKVKVDKQEVLKIKHIHLSNILHIQSEDERFPTKAGKDNFEYLQKIMAERSRDEVISVRDDKHVNRIINYSDIMYIKADHNYIRIYMAGNNNDIRVRENLSEFMRKLPEGFISVSRSVCVNRSYVKTVHRQDIIMIDDAQFRIPVKSCVQVKQAIFIK